MDVSTYATRAVEPDRDATGWERVAHRLPDEVGSLAELIDLLAHRLGPFLRDEGPETLLAEAKAPSASSSAIQHAEEQIDRLRDQQRRVRSLIDRLDI